MIPLWMFPLAVACGNAFVLKPSERAPGAAMLLAQLALEAGLPPGVLNVVHGGRAAVNALLDAPEVAAVSFVGGDSAGRHIAQRAAEAGKRAQINMGAKNHAVVLPDAPPAATAAALAAAAFGAAGQRCMALSVVVLVGDCSAVEAHLVAAGAALRCGDGADAATDVGPLISPAAAERARSLVASALADGAAAPLDGRVVAGLAPHLDASAFLGPTILTGVRPEMEAYRQEIFAPVLLCLRADSLDAAIALINANPYGNGAAVFTRDGAAARRFCAGVEAGQVGVNVPIPVAVPLFSFTGWRASFGGDLHFYGQDGVRFFTRTKTVTQRWRDPGEGEDGNAAAGKAPQRAALAMPTSADK
jgi:malonate-semialdehyde dehydrogenase (acetylating)/methylmalonate-semialdehyde dehydrogenase